MYYTLGADLCPRHTVVMLVGLTNMLTLCYSTSRLTLPIQIHPVEYTRIRCVLLLSNIIEGNLMGLTLDFTWLLCPCIVDHVVSILLYFVHTVNKFVLQMIGKLYMARIFGFTLLHILTGCCSAMCVHHIVIGVAHACRDR